MGEAFPGLVDPAPFAGEFDLFLQSDNFILKSSLLLPGLLADIQFVLEILQILIVEGLFVPLVVPKLGKAVSEGFRVSEMLLPGGKQQNPFTQDGGIGVG